MSDISCNCSSSDYDGWSFGTQEIRTARKNYRCCECGDPIKPGDKYEYVRGMWEGYYSTYRTCLICKKIRSDYCPDGYIFMMLDETLRECLGVGLH